MWPEVSRGRVGRLLLSIGCLHALVAGRVLDDVAHRVSSPEEFRAALLSNARHILFASSIALDPILFPEAPDTCLATRSVANCSRDVVVYGDDEHWAPQSSAVWEAADELSTLWLDFEWLQASIVLARPLTISGLSLSRMLHSSAPHVFGFATVDSGSLLIQNSQLLMPCGRTPLTAGVAAVLGPGADCSADGDGRGLRVSASRPASVHGDHFQGQLRLVDVVIQCSDSPAIATQTSSVPIAAIAAPVAVVAVALALLALCCALRRRHKPLATRLGSVKVDGNAARPSPAAAGKDSAFSPPSAAAGMRDSLPYDLQALGGLEQQLVLESVIGRGSRGVVYLGSWKGLRVAVKTITAPQSVLHLADESAANPFASAAAALALAHPNIAVTYHHDVKLLPLGATGGRGVEGAAVADASARSWRLSVVQEWCSGGNIATAIRNQFFVSDDEQTPHLRRVCQATREMASALQYVHSKGIVHGSLHPNNVLLAGTGPSTVRERPYTNADIIPVYPELGSGFVTKVVDIGLSIKRDATQAPFSAMREGTAYYVAPEVQSGGDEDKASDVYSFGVLMWELCHCKPSFICSVSGGFTRSGDFPKLPPTCPLPYAVLTVACLHPKPACRPSLDTIVSILTDMQRALDAGDALPGATSQAPLITPRPFMSATGAAATPAQQKSALEHAVYAANSTARLVPIVNQQEAALSDADWRCVLGELDKLAGVPSAETMADQAMDQIAEGLRDADGPVMLMLNGTLDTATELGHGLVTGPDTSDEESDDFHDAMDELATDGSITSPRDSAKFNLRDAPAKGVAGALARPPQQKRLTGDAMAAALSPYHALMRRQSPAEAPSPPPAGAPSPGTAQHSSSGALPTTTTSSSQHQTSRGASLPNSGMSDWDAMSAQNELVEDTDTGRTHFRHVRRVNVDDQLLLVHPPGRPGERAAHVAGAGALPSNGLTLDRIMSGEGGGAAIDGALLDKVAQSMRRMYSRGATEAESQQRSDAGARERGGCYGSGPPGAARDEASRWAGGHTAGASSGHQGRGAEGIGLSRGSAARPATASRRADVGVEDDGSDSDSAAQAHLLRRPVISKTGRVVLLQDAIRNSLSAAGNGGTSDAAPAYIGSRPGNAVGSVGIGSRAARSFEGSRPGSMDSGIGTFRLANATHPSSRPTSVSKVDDTSILNSRASSMTSTMTSTGNGRIPLPDLARGSAGGPVVMTGDVINSAGSVGSGTGVHARADSVTGGTRFASGSFVSMTSTGEGYVTNRVPVEQPPPPDAMTVPRGRWVDALEARSHSEGTDKSPMLRGGEFRPMRALSAMTRSYDRCVEGSGAAGGARGVLLDDLEDDASESDQEADSQRPKVSVTDVVMRGWGTVDDAEGSVDPAAERSGDGSGRVRPERRGGADYGEAAAHGLGGRGQGRGADSAGGSGSEDDSPLSMRGLHSSTVQSVRLSALADASRADDPGIDLNPRPHAAQPGANRKGRPDRRSTAADRARAHGAGGIDAAAADEAAGGRVRAVRPRIAAQPPQPELHNFVHPVLRRNKAAMAHVRHVARPAHEDAAQGGPAPRQTHAAEAPATSAPMSGEQRTLPPIQEPGEDSHTQ